MHRQLAITLIIAASLVVPFSAAQAQVLDCKDRYTYNTLFSVDFARSQWSNDSEVGFMEVNSFGDRYTGTLPDKGKVIVSPKGAKKLKAFFRITGEVNSEGTCEARD